MKITGLSHLFKWENLHNWWLTKYFFAPLYISTSPIEKLADHFQTIKQWFLLETARNENIHDLERWHYMAVKQFKPYIIYDQMLCSTIQISKTIISMKSILLFFYFSVHVE